MSYPSKGLIDESGVTVDDELVNDLVPMQYQDRKYQDDLENDVHAAHAQGAKNVFMRLDTGGGKTKIVSTIHRKHQGASAVLAHRHELVSQISVALGRQGLFHRIIGSDKTHRACVQEHLAEFGKSFVAPGAPAAVASVDTLVRAQGLESWFGTVTRYTCDEAHHLIDGNKWHSCVEKFSHPSCLGLGASATPRRADGKGLGRHADGVFDVMVEGPPMRWLIDQNFLTDYRIVCPKSDLELLEEAGASGDWSTKQMREAAKRSHIIGDTVKAYLKWAPGKRTVVFATDVETAEETADAFRKAGVRAEVLTGETDPGFRRQMLKNFADGLLDVVVAVDIISEGFDLPAIDCVIMARPTQSLALYMQQFGRALRIMAGKLYALIIDLVGNVIRHQGPPDKQRVWSLDRRDKKASGPNDAIPMRVCLNPECLSPFEAYLTKCPYCLEPIPAPVSRGRPAAVEGDLAELSPDVLAALRGEASGAILPHDAFLFDALGRGVPPQYIAHHAERHAEKREAQLKFRPVMMQWINRQLARGLLVGEVQRLFWMTFNVDIVTAQTLGTADVAALCAKVEAKL